ncbi:uncharacterized protein [Epargyreus clarus]|uniref:uncharacterized protein n=1 Tax=Epargyreus clarus TaxID=520877 RepID=UPI003C2BB965
MITITRDVVKSRLYVKAECSTEMNGHYDMSGQLLFLSIRGHGKFKVIIRKGVFSVTCALAKTTKPDGKIHWHVKDWKYTFELRDKSTLVFENLFEGNELLARAAREVIDSGSNDVVLEIGKPIFDSIMGTITSTINQFYDAVPEEDLALD